MGFKAKISMFHVKQCHLDGDITGMTEICGGVFKRENEENLIILLYEVTL